MRRKTRMPKRGPAADASGGTLGIRSDATNGTRCISIGRVMASCEERGSGSTVDAGAPCIGGARIMFDERGTKGLAQLTDREFFGETARGLRLVVANALSLWRDYQVLQRRGRQQGGEILRAFVEEEAAKFFILLDAVRCPRAGPFLGRQLTYFYSHLAKGIYADVIQCSLRDFAEVLRYVAQLRTTYYLDGPEGFEWIFRNRILERREQAIYVNCERTEEGLSWLSPRQMLVVDPWGEKPVSLALAQAMCRLGFAKDRSLATIAGLWRSFRLEETTHWSTVGKQNLATVQALQGTGGRGTTDDASLVADRWMFPLYPLDLRLDGPSVQDLVTQRRHLEEAWERSIYGVPDEY